MASDFIEGSGNVFVDLGVTNPEAAQRKARLAHAIYQAIRAQGLTVEEAAAVLGVEPDDVARIVRGRLSDDTEAALARYLAALAAEVIELGPLEEVR